MGVGHRCETSVADYRNCGQQVKPQKLNSLLSRTKQTGSGSKNRESKPACYAAASAAIVVGVSCSDGRRPAQSQRDPPISMGGQSMLRVSYQELMDALLRGFLKLGFEAERARGCAQLFANTDRDGVYAHGLNRFPRFLSMIQSGLIDIHAEPVPIAGSGPLERWDGKLGPGNLNASQCVERAIALSQTHGMGCVALANTNHWMRGGSYGWQAADAGVIGICWTNTLATYRRGPPRIRGRATILS
jgi:Malate/L-lactate dehydrogenase